MNESALEEALARGEYARVRAALRDEVALPPLVRAAQQRHIHYVAATCRVGELDDALAVADRLLAVRAGHDDPEPTIDLLTLAVPAAGALARYDQALSYLKTLLQAARRSGTLRAHLRARGTAASCFAQLGDPWAARRILEGLLTMIGSMPNPRVLEAVTRCNIASVRLQAARSERDAGHAARFAEELEGARTGVQWAAVVAREEGNHHVMDLCALHLAEVCLLEGDGAGAQALLRAPLKLAFERPQAVQRDRLAVLTAEAQVLCVQPAEALDLLEQVRNVLGPGHDLELRLRWHRAQAEALQQDGQHRRAWAANAEANRVEAHRTQLQLRAISQHLRDRLELEHLYSRPAVEMPESTGVRPAAPTPAARPAGGLASTPTPKPRAAAPAPVGAVERRDRDGRPS